MLSSLNFSEVTPIQKEDVKKIKIILQSLLDHNDACDFREPVDWKGLGLNDYPQVIKNPMDLGTVNKKFNTGNYASVEYLLDDIQLIWDNCKKYNPPKSWIYQIGQRLQRAFRKMARNYFPDMGITVPIKIQDQSKKQTSSLIGFQEDYQDITYHDKLKFSQQLSYLSAKKLQTIIKQIKKECPTAYRQTQEGKCQILVDNIQLNKFAELFTHIRQINNQIQEKQQKIQDEINQYKDPKPNKKVKTS